MAELTHKMSATILSTRALRSFWPNQLAIVNSEAVLAVILALYAGLIILWPGPGLHPSEFAMATLLRGEYLDPNTFVLPNHGRFFPLNGQEYNLLVPFTKSPIFYNGLMAVQFLIAIIAIYLLMKRALVIIFSNKHLQWRFLPLSVVLVLAQ